MSYAQTEIDEIALLNQEIRRLTEDDSVKRRLEFASDVLKAEDPLSTLKSMGVRNERLMIVHQLSVPEFLNILAYIYI